jgi:hypothetical protein
MEIGDWLATAELDGRGYKTEGPSGVKIARVGRAQFTASA